MHHAIFGQAEGNNGRKYGETGENERKNDIKAYVKAGMFHGMQNNKLIELVKLIELIELPKLSGDVNMVSAFIQST